MTKVFFFLAAIPVAMQLGAAPVYNLGSLRYFGNAAGRTNGTVNQPLTGATDDELVIPYFDGNEYNGRSAIEGAPVLMETSTSVGINQAVTTDNISGFLARDRVTLYDDVVVTGGSGTAYLAPLVQISGVFTDNSALLFGSVNVCFGTSSCVLQSAPGGISTGGVQNVDVLWSPSPLVYLPAYEITFGVPVTAFMFFGTNITAFGGQGVNVPAGESLSADFQYELLGYRVLDSDGNELQGVTVQSGALNLPEPGSGVLGALGLALLLAARRLRGAGAAGTPRGVEVRTRQITD